MSKTCLVLLAHGSRNPEWLQPFEVLARNLKRDLGEANIVLSYMEHAAPPLAEVAEQVAGRGVRTMRILPLFMASGNHLQQDIPDSIAAIGSRFPELQIELMPPIGTHPLFMSLMEQVIREYVTLSNAESNGEASSVLIRSRS